MVGAARPWAGAELASRGITTTTTNDAEPDDRREIERDRPTDRPSERQWPSKKNEHRGRQRAVRRADYIVCVVCDMFQLGLLRQSTT